MLTPIVEPDLIVAFPVWVIILSIMLLFHLANVAEGEILGFAARYTDETGSGEGVRTD